MPGEGRGGRPSSATPAGRSCPPTTRCWTTRSGTSSSGTSRARPTWPTASRGRAGRSASPSRPPGPGATNLTTGIATAMLDSSPTVFITGQVSSKVLGTDAFQEVDVTGITLPITKHNSLVTEARHIAHTIREAFVIARSGRPGPGARRHHQGRPAGQGRLPLPRHRAPARAPRARAARRGEPRPRGRAHRQGGAAAHPRRGRGHALRGLAGAARVRGEDGHPGRPHPPRHRRLPAEPPALPRHDGHARRGLRQQRDPARRPPPRLRHALRRPGHRQHQDLRACTRRRSTSRSTPPRSART